ncbi:MAG: phosphoglycerate mutase family protein [Bacteroidota bacterium]
MESSINTLQKTLKALFIFPVLFLGVFSCNDTSKDIEINTEPIVSTFYLIRHSEKDRSDLDDPDPELEQKGLDRAIRWAEVFDPVPLDAIYSTNYERTTMTAAPTSVKKNIDIEFYDPQNVDIEEFKLKNIGANVLVVGHSNTTPDFVNKLLGEEKYAAMDDNDNSSLFIVRFIDDQVTHIQLNMD